MNYSKRKFMRTNLKPIILFLLLMEFLSSNIFAEPSVGFGDLKLQVVAGKPAGFSDPSLPGGKYPASLATVSIYKPNVDFIFEDTADYQGQLIIRDLPAGLNRYEILFWDFLGDRWRAEGSVSIKNGELASKLVELKRETWSR